MNGNLVSIENEAENNFVYRTLNARLPGMPSAWIGLYRNPTSRKFLFCFTIKTHAPI